MSKLGDLYKLLGELESVRNLASDIIEGAPCSEFEHCIYSAIDVVSTEINKLEDEEP